MSNLLQSDDEIVLKEVGASGLIEHAAKGLMRLVSWAFSSGEDLQKSLGSSASKALHREQPKRSLTSRMEDGTLNGVATRSDSMLAPDLVPHYLGKTPKAVKARRDGVSQYMEEPPAFKIPKFDSAQFKIPALPTPTNDQISRNKEIERKTLDEPPRGKGMKSLVFNQDTQSRHDEELTNWLSSQKLSPEDLVSLRSLDDARVDDYDKLRRIMNDESFFRRKGLFPPIKTDQARGRNRSVEGAKRAANGGQVGKQHSQRSTSHGSAISIDMATSDRSSTTIRGQRIDPRHWQTNSSSGILAAWREICEKQESVARNNSLDVGVRQRRVSRSPSDMSIQRGDPTLWHEGISFSQSQQTEADALDPVPEVDTNAIEAGEKYWAPIRSFPMPSGKPNPDVDMKSIASTLQIPIRHRRQHSRQASVSRRPRQQRSRSTQGQQRDTRQDSPVSIGSSRQSSSRRPTHAKRAASHSRRASAEPQTQTPKIKMVEAQVQTTDELMTFLKDDPIELFQQKPTISKERRKRPGCFSALDEDMEELFGPYSDVAPKKAKLAQDDEDYLVRPRVPLLREDDEVKKLRALKEAERAAMPPPPPPTVPSDARGPAEVTKAQASANLAESSLPGVSSVSSAQSKEPETSIINPQPTFSFGTATKVPANDSAQSGSRIPQESNTIHNAIATASDTQPALELPPTTNNTFSKPASFPSFDFGHSPRPSIPTVAPSTFSFGTPISKTDAARVRPVSAGIAADASSSEVPKPKDTAKPFSGFAQASGFADSAKFAPVADFGFGSTKKDEIETGRTDQPDQALPNGSTTTSILKSSTPSFNFGTSGAKPVELIDSSNAIVDKAPAQGSLPASNSFTFGKSNQPDVPKPNSSTPTFSFGPGSKSDTAAATATAPATTASTTFNFGMKTTSELKEPATSPFGFIQGTANKTDIAAIPSFGDNAQPAQGATFGGLPSKGSLFGGTEKAPVVATKTDESEKKNPAFTFGKVSEKGKTDTGIFGSNGFQTAAKESTGLQSTTPFGFPNTSSTVAAPSFGSPAPNPAIGTAPSFSFGQAAASNPPPFSFGSSKPNEAQQQNHSGGSATTAPNTIFGAQPSSGPNNLFGQVAENTTMGNSSNNGALAQPAFGFGANPSVQQPATGFNFGANPGANGMSGTTNNAPAPSTTTGATFSFGQTQPTAFQFGAQPNTQPAQPFAFGQTQTAPNSGFASPAALSPSIQSATAPGSPNPFNFTAAPGQAAQAGPGGPRKMATARSRRLKK